MSQVEEPSVIILAGGQGTRLKSVFPEIPKALVPIVGRPFIFYLLDQVWSAGFSTVIVATGYLGHLIEEQLGTRYRSLTINYSREQQPLGTGGAFKLAAAKHNVSSYLVMNGDSYCELNLRQFTEWHLHCGHAVSLVAVENSNLSQYGKVVCNSDGRVVCFSEKVTSASAGSIGLINGGVYMINRSCLVRIKDCDSFSLERDTFTQWATQGILYAKKETGPFIDIGTPERYVQAQEFFKGITGTDL